MMALTNPAIDNILVSKPDEWDLYFRTEDNKYENNFISRSSLRPIDSPYGHCAANPGNDKNFEKELDKNIKELLY